MKKSMLLQTAVVLSLAGAYAANTPAVQAAENAQDLTHLDNAVVQAGESTQPNGVSISILVKDDDTVLGHGNVLPAVSASADGDTFILSQDGKDTLYEFKDGKWVAGVDDTSKDGKAAIQAKLQELYAGEKEADDAIKKADAEFAELDKSFDETRAQLANDAKELDDYFAGVDKYFDDASQRIKDAFDGAEKRFDDKVAESQKPAPEEQPQSDAKQHAAIAKRFNQLKARYQKVVTKTQATIARAKAADIDTQALEDALETLDSTFQALSDRLEN